MNTNNLQFHSFIHKFKNSPVLSQKTARIVSKKQPVLSQKTARIVSKNSPYCL